MLLKPTDDFHYRPTFDSDDQLLSCRFGATVDENFGYYPRQEEPFFKKDYFGMEQSLGDFSTAQISETNAYETPGEPSLEVFPDVTPAGNVKETEWDKQDVFDGLTRLQAQLQACELEERFSLRQDLFVSSINALTHPQTDVVLIQLGQACVLTCIDLAITDLDIDFLNIGIIFLLQIQNPRLASTCQDPTVNKFDKRVQDVLHRRADKTSELMQSFAKNRPGSSLREDAVYLGNEMRHTFMDLVFNVRFEFLRNLRHNHDKTRPVGSKPANRETAKKYQDRALTCCPGGFNDPPKTPFYAPMAGFWVNANAFFSNTTFPPKNSFEWRV